MSFLKVTHLSKTENGKGNILQDISFSQREFQKIAIAGETGSGKSTLLKIIAGLVQPDAGQVTFAGRRVKGPAEQLVAGQPEIAYLSQHVELPEFLRVEQVLRYANSLTNHQAFTLYDVCQINHLLSRRTNELSGGEKQRIALARLLTTSPSLLLLDGPFSNLDLINKNELKTVIRNIGEQLAISCLLVSHDPQDTLPWADEILVLRNGKFLQQGSPQQIYQNPLDDYVAGLFGKFNSFTSAQMAFFLRPEETTLRGEKFFLRPEQLEIVSTEKSGLQGEVTGVSFFGGYYETEVRVEHQRFIVKAASRPCTVGDVVGIQLKSI